MAFEGDLQNLALGDVLQTLAMSRQTGTFVIRSASEERRLVFGPRGCGLLTARQALREHVGEYLVAKGKVTPEDLEQATKQARRKNNPAIGVEDILRDKGTITEADVTDARRYVAGEDVYDLFLWQQGAFEFISGDPTDLSPFGNAWFDVVSLSMESARRMDEVSRLRDTCPLGEVLCRDDEGPDPASLKLSADAKHVLPFTDGTRTVDLVLAATHIGRFDSWKALGELLDAGVVRAATPQELALAADGLVRSKDHTRNAAILNRLLEHAPDDDVTRRKLVLALTAAGDKKGAAAQWLVIAGHASEASDAPAAAEAFRQASRLDKDSAAAQEGLARALLDAGDLVAGAEAARAAATLHLDAGRADAAVQVAEIAVRSCPEDASVRISLANAQIAAGDPAAGLLMLDDAASLLEATGDDDRRLLDVYRRILQLDPSRKDCARRVEQIESTEKFRRKRLVQRLAVAVAVVLVALVSLPMMSGPSFATQIQAARLAAGSKQLDEARTILEQLELRNLSEDESTEIRVVREMLVKLGPKSQTEQAAARLAEALEQSSNEAAEAQVRSWAECLARYHKGLEQLDGADGKLLGATDLNRLNRLRKEFLDDLNGSVAALYEKATSASVRVTGTREKFTAEVFKKEDPAVLRDLVERTEEAAKIRDSQDWVETSRCLDQIRKRIARMKDGLDKKTSDAIQGMLEAFGPVEREGARALASLRKKQLLEKHREAYGRGQELSGAGKLEDAEAAYREFVTMCADLRRAEPRDLYDAIVRDYVDGMNLEAPIAESARRLSNIREAEGLANAALEKGDVAEAFRIRSGLVRANKDVDFRTRFRLPVRIQSHPAGAGIAVFEEAATERALGTTPLPRFDYAVDTGAKLVLRLDGFDDVTVTRSGAAEDSSGVVDVELPKRAEFAVAGADAVQAAPVQSETGVILAGRDGRVRLRSATDGKDLLAPFSTGSLAGMASAPALFGGHVFIATLDGAGFVLDARTLEKLGNLKFDGPVRGALLGTPRGVFAVTESGTAQLLDAAGAVIWSKQVGRTITDPCLAGTRIVVVNAQGEIVALDAATGDAQPRIRLPDDARWGAPAAFGDRVVVAGDGGGAACVDLGARRVIWSVAVGSPVRAAPVFAASRVVIVTATGCVQTLDPSTGATLSRDLLGAPVRHAPVALGDGWAVATERGSVVRFAADGSISWRFDAKADMSSQPAVVGGRLLFVTRKGALVSLRP
ncbi:MAG: PQQ-binding-like beta-propeller repeat protein [Planctomycetes bacterium]|nr:PQQ-binding-like beta-propeller repeat protein [Planctomycetota bacterium]